MNRILLLLICLLTAATLAQTTSTSSDDLPTRNSIVAVLQREHRFLNRVSPMRLINRKTGDAIVDRSHPATEATLDRGPENGFSPVDYTSGVTYAGMLLAREVTGDPRYDNFVVERLQFLHDLLPYSEAQVSTFGTASGSVLQAVTNAESLDDCGAMCAALIKARKAKIGPDFESDIARWMKFILNDQFRLADGLLARHRPQVASVWADDCYMSVPALAQAERFDEAATQMLGIRDHLFQPSTGLFTHGENLNQPISPAFYWARGNGWAAMSLVELLDVLPPNHARRAELLTLLQQHLKSLASLQASDGRWHQLLDKPDSFLETSASAMFTFAIARAINRQWISPVTFGPVAVCAWEGVAAQVNENGEVEGTCVATTFANTNAYYYGRKTSVNAGHGYGPVLLAGAEMIRLVESPAFSVKTTNGALHFVPKEVQTR